MVGIELKLLGRAFGVGAVAVFCAAVVDAAGSDGGVVLLGGDAPAARFSKADADNGRGIPVGPAQERGSHAHGGRRLAVGCAGEVI